MIIVKLVIIVAIRVKSALKGARKENASLNSAILFMWRKIQRNAISITRANVYESTLSLQSRAITF